LFVAIACVQACVCTRMRHGLRNAGRHDVDVIAKRAILPGNP